MNHRTRRATVLVGLLAACGDGAPSAHDETAAELRALRVFLQQQPRQEAHAAAAPATRTALVEALAPLREVVTALARAQGEQAARQLALTQELQRWSQLLIETIGGTRADETKTMEGKLQQLEQALREQEARHREVETLLQGALDRTAERLEGFLDRLDGASGKAPTQTPPSVPATTNDPAPTNKAPPSPPGKTPPGDDHAPPPSTPPPSTGRSVSSAARAEQWLWLALGAAGLGVGAFFVRRARRAGRPLRHDDLPANGAPAQPDSGVDEIWAAAALLGETVSRLRQSAAAPAPPVATPGHAVSTHTRPTHAVPDELDLDEVFVLDEFDSSPTAKAAAPTAPLRTTPPANGPHLVVCRLAAADLGRARAAAARLLADDPRVLRRPAPSLVPVGNRLEVTFATLPGLPAGERSLLEQRLRDAVA